MKSIIIIFITSALLLIALVVGVLIFAFPKNTNKPNATSTPTPQSVTPTPHASATTTTPTASTSPSPVETMKIKIFLVALEDKGQRGKQIGCGDSMVSVERTVPKTEGVLKAALENLLAVKTRVFENTELYNALYQSSLTIKSVAVTNGTAKIELIGTVALGGVCDNPRFEEQLKQTAMQFPTVTATEIKINDKPLQEVLSLK